MSAPTTTTVLPAAPRRRARAAAARRGARARRRLSPWHAALAGGPRAVGPAEPPPSRPERLREHLLLGRACKSELASWHNLLFVSFDAHGFISIDKPPVALWVQALSAEIFGFKPMSLLVPEAIAGVLSVFVLYRIVAPRCGRAAGVASALALAVYPSFVAVSRDNGPDAVLILLMLCACAVGLNAVQSGRWRSLLGCALLVGVAFNTKTLAALLIVPGLALAYVACAPGSLRRRLGQLLVAGALLVIVSGAWISFVDLTPASQRPYVGSSADNSEFNLTFEYNGLGRVNGEVGGPGQVAHVDASSLPPSVALRGFTARAGEYAGVAVRGGARGVIVLSGAAPAPPFGPAARARARLRALGAEPAPAARLRRLRPPACSRSRPPGTPASRARSAGRPGRCACSASASVARTAGSCRSRSSACWRSRSPARGDAIPSSPR